MEGKAAVRARGVVDYGARKPLTEPPCSRILNVRFINKLKGTVTLRTDISAGRKMIVEKVVLLVVVVTIISRYAPMGLG